MVPEFIKRGLEEADAGAPTPTPDSPQARARVDSRTRLVVGATIGSVVAFILVVVGILLWRHYRRVRSRSTDNADGVGVTSHGTRRGTGAETPTDMYLTPGRPSSVYSTRPLSDPFAAEVKTVISRDGGDRDTTSPVTTPNLPQLAECTFTQVPIHPPQLGSFERLSDLRPPSGTYHDTHNRTSSTVSAELRRAMPELSGTFLANVRPTTHSPPPAA